MSNKSALVSTRAMLDLIYCFHTQISVDVGLSKADQPAFVWLSGVLAVPASRSWKSFIRLTGSSAAVLGKNGLFIAELHLMGAQQTDSNAEKTNHVFTRKLCGFSGLMI